MTLLIDINFNSSFIRTLESSITCTVLIPIVLLQILLILEAHEEHIVPLKGLTAAAYYFPHNYLHFCVTHILKTTKHKTVDHFCF